MWRWTSRAAKWLQHSLQKAAKKTVSLLACTDSVLVKP
jgi:hypothetical protein